MTLALDGNRVRSMVGGAYVVDDFSLVLKALFLVTGYVVVLMATNYVEEGDYYQGEFYFLLLCSLLGMVVMSSSRDLVTIFVALETLSIPGYLLAGWRKRDLKSNEASMKYYLLGVLASAVMLYGMSLVYGYTGTTVLAQIGQRVSGHITDQPVITVGIFFIVVGFAFKVSAVPFHFWAPDTYEGAPTPVTAFLSVASKTGGFVALVQLIYVGFLGRAFVEVNPVPKGQRLALFQREIAQVGLILLALELVQAEWICREEPIVPDVPVCRMPKVMRVIQNRDSYR